MFARLASDSLLTAIHSIDMSFVFVSWEAQMQVEALEVIKVKVNSSFSHPQLPPKEILNYLVASAA